MIADINLVNERILKQLFIYQLNKVNHSNLDIDVDSVHFAKTSDNRVLLRDNSSPAGVVINKISINDLFGEELDLSQFKNLKVNQQIKGSFYPDELNRVLSDFNTKMSKVTVTEENDVIEGFRGVPEDILNDFVLFCKVTGFFGLKAKEISLTKEDNVLTIEIPSTHLLFSGQLKVLV
ncbi:MAG: hypothetical protein ACRCVV_10640 [Shewanella sp.]